MNSNGGLILLVEDNEADAEITLRALRRNHLANHIHLVRDGQEALDYLFAQDAYADRRNLPRPQLILLDLKLPKVDGLEVLKQIRSSELTRLIPVVILTSSKEESDITNGYGLGANSYVVKPVEFEQFVEAVVRLGLYWLVLNESPS